MKCHDPLYGGALHHRLGMGRQFGKRTHVHSVGWHPADNGEQIGIADRKFLSQNPGPVEIMRFEFGVDTNSDGAVDAYLKTSDVTDSLWDQRRDGEIVSVQIHLLLKAFQQDSAFRAGMSRTYPMPGGALSVPDDGYRRKHVSTTVVIRNPWLKTAGETL